MAYLLTVNPTAKLVTISGHGGQILAEAKETTSLLLADQRLNSKFRILIVGDENAPPPAPADIAQLAEQLKLLRRRISGRIAIVASTVTLSTPANVIALLGSQPTLGNVENVRAFATEAEARAWVLGGDI